MGINQIINKTMTLYIADIARKLALFEDDIVVKIRKRGVDVIPVFEDGKYIGVGVSKKEAEKIFKL